MLIRALTENDLEDCAKLHGEAFDKPWFKAELEDLFKNVHISGFCTEKNAIITGFIIYQHIIDEVEIYTICAGKAYQRQGIATAILDALEVRCLQQSPTRIFLDVSEANIAAQSLYQKNGYNVISKRKGYYYEQNKSYDALIMQKIIKIA